MTGHPDWTCRAYTDFCCKNYFARYDDPLLPLLSGPKERKAFNVSRREEDGRRAQGAEVHLENMTWGRLAQRYGWDSYAPPIEHGGDVFELAAISNALLQYKAEVRRSGGIGRRDFVIVELGAGFGRWSLEATALARRLHVKVKSICVEAEPQHVRFLEDAFWEMEVPEEQVEIIVAVVGEEDGQGWFVVGNAREWWGQSLKLELDPWDQDTADPVEAKQTRWQPVLVISLKTLLEREAIVDLVNFNCQDSEVHVIRGATTVPGDVLSKIKMMVISTHSWKAENEILALLCSHGWHLVATNPISAARPGGISFHANLILGRISKGPTDGLQIWANPKHVNVEQEFGAFQVQGCFSLPYAFEH